MNPFQKEYDEMIEILTEAQQRIQAINNPDISSLKARIVAGLVRDIGVLNAGAIRTGDMTPVITQRREPKPLRSYFGNQLRDPEKRKKVQPESQIPLKLGEFNKKVQETTEEQQGRELRQTVERIWDDFPDMQPDQIRDMYSDIEILGVARKADLPVTLKTPVDLPFIEKVQDAVVKAKELKEKKMAEKEKYEGNKQKEEEIEEEPEEE